jgi:hypothetical protein
MCLELRKGNMYSEFFLKSSLFRYIETPLLVGEVHLLRRCNGGKSRNAFMVPVNKNGDCCMLEVRVRAIQSPGLFFTLLTEFHIDRNHLMQHTPAVDAVLLLKCRCNVGISAEDLTYA